MFGKRKQPTYDSASYVSNLVDSTPKFKISYSACIGQWCLFESCIEHVNFSGRMGIAPFRVAWREIKRARSDSMEGCQEVYKDIKNSVNKDVLYLD